MTTRRRVCGVLVILAAGVAVLGLAVSGRAAGTDAKSASFKLADLNWLAGFWRAELGGDVLEEHWMAPSGDCMIGSFRWMKGGKVWMFEVLSITEEEQGIVLRLKHFDKRMVGWEEKDKAMTWTLAKLDQNQAVFENQEQDTNLFSFHRDGATAITVRLQGTKDGKPSTKEFQYKRQ